MNVALQHQKPFFLRSELTNPPSLIPYFDTLTFNLCLIQTFPPLKRNPNHLNDVFI